MPGGGEMMNIRNIEKLINLLEKTKTYHQTNYVEWCNSPGCIAGHAVYLKYNLANSTKTMEDLMLEIEFFEVASDYLGFDRKKPVAKELFHPHPLNKALNAHYKNESMYQAKRFGRDHLNPTPQDAIQVLRHLIETGEVDWGICLQETKQMESRDIGE